MKKNNTFSELLCLNDSLKIKEFLIKKGKSPKPICPVSFNQEDDLLDEENENKGE